MLGLYESISALATKINRLCCAVQQLQNNEGAPYLKYVALLSQVGTDDPTAIVLQNDFDADITYLRNQAGEYSINSTEDIFIENKTWAVASTPDFGTIMQIGRISAPECIIYCWANGGGLIDLNSSVYETSIEIRVYS